MNYSGTKITMENGCFNLGGETLLDCRFAIENHSRVPLYDTGDDSMLNIPELIVKNKEDHLQINAGTEQEEYADVFMIMDTLLSDFFMHRGEPLKAAEIGCNIGSYSTHMASLLHSFDPAADYACVTNSIGNESDSQWLDRISMVEAPAGLALIASDFNNTMLRDNYFDCTVINGTVQIPETADVIKEAGRITNDDGMIMCYSEDQYLLDDMFQMMFPVRREWRFSPKRVLFTARRSDMWVPDRGL